MIMLNQPNNAMDIVADILADEQENTISSYQYNGVELTPAEPVTMRNTFLLTIFNPSSNHQHLHLTLLHNYPMKYHVIFYTIRCCIS